MRKIFSLSGLVASCALLSVASIGDAAAAMARVDFSGVTGAGAGGPYTASGGFDYSAPGDLPTDLAWDDSAVSNFQLILSGGTDNFIFDASTIAGELLGGTFNLAAGGANGQVCFKTVVSGCNPQAGEFVVTFSSGSILYGPNGGNTGASQFSITVTDVSEVPLPAGMLLMLTGLTGIAAAGKRRKQTA